MKVVLISASCLIALIGVVAVIFYVIDYMQPSADILNLETADREADLRILLVGNNDVFSSDIHHLIQALLEEAVPTWDDVLVVRHAPANYTIEMHALDLQRNGHPLNQAMMTGGPTMRAWDYVILAENTPYATYASHEPEAVASSFGATIITQAATVNQSRVLLFEAWAYREGDAENSFLYPDFVTMQRYINRGYERLATDLGGRGQSVGIIPVGEAYTVVYSDTAGQFGSPFSDRGYFASLYADDGQRSSLAGDYLAACVVVSLIIGEPLGSLTDVPDGLDPALAAYLRGVSDRVLFKQAIDVSVQATDTALAP